MTDDKLNDELRRFDPADPAELAGSAATPRAEAVLQRILATDPAEPVEPALRPGRRRPPRLVLAPLALAAAAAILLLIIGLPGGGEGDGGGKKVGPLTDALDRAASAAASLPGAAAGAQFLKTREMSFDTADVAQRSWRVQQETTREEWVTPDGAGRMRIVAGPTRFVGADDRAEWKQAGEPRFLPLGFGGRTEVHWLSEGPSLTAVERMPTDPTALAERLRAEARAIHGKVPVTAATLGLLAEDLRNPEASPALRRGLFEAAKRIPGIRWFGRETDAAGRNGVAIGVAEGELLYSLIFDPATSEVLATETASTAPTIASDHESPTLLKATVYLESRAGEGRSEYEGAWAS
jgi:hypothetical protein